MSSAFDTVASSYDQEFTDTPIGRAQRDRVWRYLRQLLEKYENARILELNCGTGEDACFLAGLGHEVLATDISTEMLKQTQQKAEKAKLQDKILIKQLDLAAPELEGEAPFDVIFSNFGGLNCLSGEELRRLAGFCELHLNVGGACVFVVMPPKTLLEKYYRWWKNEREVYLARDSHCPIHVSLSNKEIATYFHSPAEMEAYFSLYEKIKSLVIGYIPSYFNQIKGLPILMMGEHLAILFGIGKNRSDHYLIHFQKKASAMTKAIKQKYD